MDIEKEVEMDFCKKVVGKIMTEDDADIPKKKVLDGRLTPR